MLQHLKKVVCGLLCYLQVSSILCEKVLINIDRIVRDLDINTLCDISAWANQLNNACKCCLFKRIPYIGTGPGQKTIEGIVSECITKNYCTQELINLLQGATDLKTALYQLYNNSVVIKKMTKSGIAFDTQGDLTEQGAKTLLEKAYKEGKLPYEDFKSVTCIKAQDIFSEKKGLHTLQLFLIKSECAQKNSYILKELEGKYSEVEKLAKLFEYKQLDDLIWPNHSKDYPSLAIPFAFLQYNNHYLSLTPTAAGRELDRFIVDYFLNPTQKNKQKAEQAYFDLGYAMSKFHQRFMKNKNDILGLTAIHGDLHYKNIFYDVATHQIILIDNAVIESSLKNAQSPMLDIGYFLLFPPAMGYIPHEIKNKIKPASLIELTVTPFLKGYISAYSRKNWPVLFDKLVEGIKNYKLLNNNLYNKFKDVMDKQFQIVKRYVQTNQFIQNNKELKNSLMALKHSLSVLAELLSIK